MTATTTTARIDPQTQEELMRQAGIWIEHSTLIEDDLPARPLAAVQAEKHQLDRYTQLVADRAAARDSKCLAQIEEPAGAAPAAVAGPGWQAAADWLRNNYQDHPNIASLCDALVAAAPALEAPSAPATSAQVQALHRARRALHAIGKTYDDSELRTRALEADDDISRMLAAAPQAPAAPSAVATQVIENLLQLARIVNTAVEDWGESFEDGSSEVTFHKEEADKLEEILEFFDSLPDAPPEEGVILSGPSRAARVLRAMAAPAAPVVDAGGQVLGEWPRVSGVGRDAESPRTLLLYLQTEASDDELRAIHDALLDGGALATHALSELMHIGYRVEGGKLVPPENLSVRASEFFGVTAVAAKATAVHSDDVAVDRFAVEMKAKLAAARAKGRGGWETCPPEVLSRMLREHADKGDPRDVANFCMFLCSLGQPISVAAPAAPAVDAISDTALLDAMERERIAVIPEFEGPWDAQIFGEDESTLACGSGATPRKAIAEALASLEARKAHDAAQTKEGGA